MGDPPPARERLRELGVIDVRLREPYTEGPCFLRLGLRGATLEIIVPPGVDAYEYALEQLGRVSSGRDREPRSEPEPELDDYLIGYRSWLIEGGRLGPWGTGDDVWRGNAEVRATCRVHRHAAPDPDCHCGFHCFHDVASAVGEDYFGLTEDPRIAVLGAVRCRGNVEVHHDGFRAEYAQPICLVGAPQLGLPSVDEPDDLVAFAAGYGKPVPAELRPPGSHDISTGQWIAWKNRY